MKRILWYGLAVLFLFSSCKKDPENLFKQIEPGEVELKFTDISKDFFDLEIPIVGLQSQYPFFFERTTPAEVWERQRRDSLELKVYDEINHVFKDNHYKEELQKMMGLYSAYFPDIKIPEIFTYSSGLQKVYQPVDYGRREAMLFIALDGFLGSENEIYRNTELLPQKEPVFPYLLMRMNPENLLPAVVSDIGTQVIPFNVQRQQFIDLMVFEGKKMIIEDALLPDVSDELKIGYSSEQLSWAEENEQEIWSYFVEQEFVFSTDKSVRERFLEPSPFSKFGNEVERESPGRIGVWTGWQICKKYLKKHPEMELKEFINKDTQEIFKESKYKPKK